METFDQKGQVWEGSFPENEFSAEKGGGPVTGHQPAETPSDGGAGKKAETEQVEFPEAKQEGSANPNQEDSNQGRPELTEEVIQEGSSVIQQDKTTETVDDEANGTDDPDAAGDATVTAKLEPEAEPEETPSDGVHKIESIGSDSSDGEAEAPEFDYSALSREDLVERLRNLLHNQSVQAIIDDVDHIKLNFYKKLKQETEQKRKKYVEEGGNIEDFRMPDDPLEQQVKDLFKAFRERKAEYNRTLEEQKTKNLELRYAVIEKIKDLVNRKESIGKTFQEFRDLQKEWRSIGLVPQAALKDMWDTYHHHVEKFYDYIKINKELRDLDLKKNLEAKIKLCEKAEELILVPSVLEAFRTLQKYHDRWREIGPVPSEVRTDIWERFKAATYKINTRHQEHFENLKKEQKKNLGEKTKLCEQAEEISHLVLKNHGDWEKRSKELLEIQNTWRTIGFAPRKDNNKIYQRFRQACDAFFERKREFYARNKELQQNNLQMKTDLCVQAEALQDSTDWKDTTDELIALQKQWKEIGPVPRRQSDHIWKRFRKACDHFFEQKSRHFKNIGKSYEENLKLKEALIEEIRSFRPGGKAEDNLARLNDFQRRWTEIGFVPIKEKETLQNRYREAIDKSLDSLKIDEKEKNIMKFRSRLSNLSQKHNGNNKLNHEREKYAARLQQLRNDIVLWENNIGFFARTKNAESMIREVENKIRDAKETITMLETKIDMIDNSDAMDE